METTVDKLEAMFQKSEADLEYIEKRLKLDFVNNKTENGGAAEETPVTILENLNSIRAKHAALCSQVKEITTAQKESMDYIRNSVGSVMELMHHFQQSTDVKIQLLTKFEKTFTNVLDSAVSHSQVPTAVGASVKPQPLRDS